MSNQGDIRRRRVWRDEPIQSAGDDNLGRAPVAQRIADLIHESHSPSSSLVYGLEGPWGCGNSSVINLVKSHLEVKTGNDWQVVTFTPWATSDTEGMLSEFFATLATIEGAGKKSEFRQAISTCARVAGMTSSLIPLVGSTIESFTEVLEERLQKPWRDSVNGLSA